MKALLLLLTGITLFTQAFAQTQPPSYSAVAFVQYQQPATDSSYDVIKKHKWHSAATRTGTNIMICGVGLTAVGAAFVIFAEVQKQPYAPVPIYEKFGAAAILTGVPMILAGAIVCGIGHLRDTHHNNRISVSGNITEIGVAYNFK